MAVEKIHTLTSFSYSDADSLTSTIVFRETLASTPVGSLLAQTIEQ